MNDLLPLVIATTPYIMLALGMALLITLTSSWIIANPQVWLFYAILAFSLPSLTSGDGSDGSLLKQVTWGSLFFFAGIQVFGITRRRFVIPTTVIPPYSLLAVIIFSLISIAWSPLPLTSLKRLVQIIGVIIIAMIIAIRSSNGTSLRQQLVFPAFIFIAIGLLTSVISPNLAYGTDGALRAIATHKNTWGQFSLLATVIFLFTFSNTKSLVSLHSVGLMMSITSLFLSKSTTSILAFGFILFLVFLYLVKSKGLVGQIAIFSMLTCLAGAILVSTIIRGDLPFSWAYEGVFRLTEKSQTLTGRTFLWQLMTNEISRHPWLGIGYGGFWRGFDGPSSVVISQLNWGPPTQAHSGYLDVVNEIGYTGAALLTFAFIVHTYKLTRLWTLLKSNEVGFHVSLLISMLFINYAESSLMRTTHLWWIVLCASIVEVHVLHKRIQVNNLVNTTPMTSMVQGQAIGHYLQ